MGLGLARRVMGLVLAALLSPLALAAAQGPADFLVQDQEPKAIPPKDDIFSLPLEQLGQVPARVPAGFDTPATSVGRALDFPSAPGQAGATVGTSPAAVYVLTEEDIRRSGIRTIPDLFRMVPGMDVARIDASKWAVSSRGFNSLFANKLLVQIDGRSIYTPLFSGVYWDEHDLVLEDIERIEVIRGPGATLWGSNAVNGIISIITKPAQETQGWLVTGLGGSEELGEGQIRYGGSLGPDTFYRFWLKYWDWDHGQTVTGEDGFDGWDMLRGGFRFDSEISGQERIMWQGDLYQADLGQRISLPFLTPPLFRTLDDRYRTRGGFVLGRYTRTISDDSDLMFQCYYDYHERHELIYQEDRSIFDVDFQHRFPLGRRNEVIWGAGYRYTTDTLGGSDFIIVDPVSRGDNLASFFIQNDTEVVLDRLHVIYGSKFESNDYTGFEIQPSVRWLYTPDERQTLWGAVSRAVRTPSRAEENATVFFSPPVPAGPLVGLPAFVGNPVLDSEELTAYELGYRRALANGLLLDVAAFYNDYDQLIGGRPLTPFLALAPPPPHVVVPVLIDNGAKAETYGVEVAASWKVNDDWQLHAGYTWLQMQLHPLAGFPPPEAAEGSSPHNQFNIRSYWNVTRALQFDTALYYVDNLPELGVPSYVRLDARLAWLPRDGVEVIVGLQNLLERDQLEFVQEIPAYQSTEAPRSIYGMIRLRY